ncbi:spore protease YyaC [Thermoactinomyces mirandus]|uniref:Spore protease YyaC n=1 Tax=Thermoactinomyces mirandus TaxID=2756294 RepID=A0A7W1XTS7_9BACL|nr:spore protease YyaC [Thermoactinomyces mirandus]MBA4602875.1 spore protease YyaC [Thermoactinomyces mirandus]
MHESITPRLPKKNFQLFRVEYNDPYGINRFSNQLQKLMDTFPSYEEVVCVSIGTDRSTGDALGPLVGTFLEKDLPPSMTVYGTLDAPVHALNLEQTISKIAYTHPRALIMAVDACLGKMKSVGWVQAGLGPIRPGAGVNKKLPEVGQIHITGIVNVAGFMEYFVLQNTRLNLVIKMAQFISASIRQAVQTISLTDRKNRILPQ